MTLVSSRLRLCSQTSPSTQSVHLIGSWDNFSKHYPMERDTKRSRGQWRGCYAFTDIICDGEGGSSPKRTGGLKMGSTYFYYYELDDGQEHHDPTLPSTTNCPYLPGQPVNLLSVPVEVQPLRFRSGSMSSMANGDVKTMNPADKFMTPRPPPPTPTILPRLNTSPTLVAKGRAARSVSPNKFEKSPWSPRAFFGLRSPAIPSFLDNDKRGRSASVSKRLEGRVSTSLPTPVEEVRRVKSVPHTREASPQSLKRSNSREPSPLRPLVPRENNAFNTTTLLIPDEIAEELEDDDNFASQLNRISFNEQRGILTQLSPPPSRVRSQSPRTRTTTNNSKPLPLLPEETLMPPPLRLRATVSNADLPRSHFSMSTISTSMSSPTDSHFNFSETPSFSDSYYEDEISTDIGSGDEFTYSPVLESSPVPVGGFSGYSLPEDQFSSEHTLRKEASLAQSKSATRATFGGAAAFSVGAGSADVANMSALEELMNDMGYLGDIIVGGK
ncbi:hypothetical protein LSUE1_G007295 [Lachnellula suecica]|uniref:Uncharacterized protein n=1 Tax=Lachnellula suecica TaxID=602035 RepID=A0A8T9BYQ8_9HELO|nr:hypothetical protein LSUE1_G007295 [Lachnellula suecica]